MTTYLLFAVGTLLVWSGGFLLLWGAFRPTQRVTAVAIGGSFLLLASMTGVFEGRLQLPLIWPVMPISVWGLAGGAVGAVIAQLRKATLGGTSRSSVGWILLVLLFAGAAWLEPDKHFDLLRGRIALNGSGLVGLITLAVVSVLVMGRLGRRAPKWGSLLALTAGSVIFGLPFAWLLLTSFKEERDMVSANGLVWVPRVQRTVPFLDPENPLLEGSYRGNWVQATVGGRTSDGGYVVEVQRPSSLRGVSFEGPVSAFRVVPAEAPVVSGPGFIGFVARELNDGRRLVEFLEPASRKGKQQAFLASELEPVRDVGLRVQNYTEALEAMPPDTHRGLLYLRNTLLLVVLNVVGTLLSSSLVAYGFARLWFPGRDALFKVLLATMMLPGAVTLLPQFLLFRSFGWVDTLYPLWVPAFFASAFNVFLLRQFFSQIPMELEDAGKIDGAGVLRIFWTIMLPQIGPALAVVSIWTFIGAWNNFMGPLIYVNTPENMPLAYALQLFQTERGGAHGMMMAFATLTILPVLALFFFAQRYFVEGVALSGLGGR